MWASSNLRSDAFLLVYDITNASSLAVLNEFNDLIDIEMETRMEAYERERANLGKARKRDTKTLVAPVKPVKIVAGNKCDLQGLREVSSKTGLEWARAHSCGFMETSARNTVNIEETFALIVRRVVEARRQGLEDDGPMDRIGSGGGGRMASMASGQGLGTRRAMTAPLSPLPGGPEKVMSLPEAEKQRWYKRFWRKMMCGRSQAC